MFPVIDTVLPTGPMLGESCSLGSAEPPTEKGEEDRMVEPNSMLTYSVPDAPAGTVMVVAGGIVPPAVVVIGFEALP